MNTNTEREELARIIRREYNRAIDRRRPTDAYDAPADAILAAGYRKPRILGYVVVGRDGLMHRVQYETRSAAQEVADEWTRDAKNTGVDWDYRVAEIVEPTR